MESFTVDFFLFAPFVLELYKQEAVLTLVDQPLQA